MVGLKKEARKISGGGVKTYSFHTFGIGKKGAYVLEGEESLNCTCKGGRLKGGIGVKAYVDRYGSKLPVSISQANAGVYFTTTTGTSLNTKLVYLADQNGYLYFRNPSTNKTEQKVFLGPSIDYCCLTTETGSVYNIFVGTADVVLTTDGSSFTSKLWDGMRGGCILG